MDWCAGVVFRVRAGFAALCNDFGGFLGVISGNSVQEVRGVIVGLCL